MGVYGFLDVCGFLWVFMSFWVVCWSLTQKNYSKLFGESLFKTIKNYSNYSPMLNWRTIGGTIEKNGQKLLKCSNYSPVLNYMCRRGRAYLK